MSDLDQSAAVLSERITDLRAMVVDRFDQLDERVERVEVHVRTTNGRVTALEKARERAQGVIFAYSWIPSTLSAVLGAGLTILIFALTGGLHT